MKIRFDFVTNSSTTGYVYFGVEADAKLEDLFKTDIPDIKKMKEQLNKESNIELDFENMGSREIFDRLRDSEEVDCYEIGYDGPYGIYLSGMELIVKDENDYVFFVAGAWGVAYYDKYGLNIQDLEDRVNELARLLRAHNIECSPSVAAAQAQM